MRRHQRGQSIAEFVTLSAVMVPLLLIVPLVGKYMDIAQTTAVASRYVAFEGAARHSSSTAGSWKSRGPATIHVKTPIWYKDRPTLGGSTASAKLEMPFPHALWYINRVISQQIDVLRSIGRQAS